MKHTRPLTFETPDAAWYTPDPSLIGQRIRHSGNGKTYVITAFEWMGATDEWGYRHHDIDVPEAGAVSIVRPISHLTGYREDGTERYIGWGSE
jgi:hypothetical protein